MNKQDKIYISLGTNCSSAVKRAKDYNLTSINYNTCPFDLMVSNLEGIIQCFTDDFKFFCDTEYLKYDFTKPAGDTNLFLNIYYNFGFNHEQPGHNNLHLSEKWPGLNMYHFVENNFKMFIERYKRRINNLYTYIQNYKNIEFIITFENNDKNNLQIKKLQNLLEKKFPNNKFTYNINYL